MMIQVHLYHTKVQPHHLLGKPSIDILFIQLLIHLYSTYISGIKRWLKFSFTPQTPTESSKNKGDKEAKHQQTSDELNSSSDGVKRTNESNTMDAIVSRLLAPQVSAEEEREYGR
jgi:hypothetical protein